MRETPAYKVWWSKLLIPVCNSKQEGRKKEVRNDADDDAPRPHFLPTASSRTSAAARAAALVRPLVVVRCRRRRGRREGRKTRAGGERPRENGAGIPLKVKPAPKTREVKHTPRLQTLKQQGSKVLFYRTVPGTQRPRKKGGGERGRRRAGGERPKRKRSGDTAQSKTRPKNKGGKTQ